MKKIYDPYEKYGVRRVVNAAHCITSYGGSISPSEVFRAMEDASKSFVYIPELQQWAGKMIAEATGAEAGLPTAGANNAIMLAAAACMMRGTELEEYDPLETKTWGRLIRRLPMHTEGLKTEFIVQRSNRNVYDHAVECAGGRIVEVGTKEGTTEEELEGAYNPEKTAAYYFTVRSERLYGYRCLPLENVIRIAHRNGVPVIVDAADELPPRKNLKRYTSMGADLVIFSGGKKIGGPNNSGLLAGRRDLIKLAHLQAYPFHGVGRPAKMSRETIVGLITALKIYLEHDEEAFLRAWEDKARWIAEQLNKIPQVEAGVVHQTTVEERAPIRGPLCYVKINEEAFGMTGEELSKKLREGDPSIVTLWEARYLLEDYENKLTLNPAYMTEGEEVLVVQRIREILIG